MIISICAEYCRTKRQCTPTGALFRTAKCRREIVIVADGNGGRLAGFVCVQLKKSFCYDEYMPEITEVYVRHEYRGRGVAREMLTFAQEYCKKIYPLHSFELLTGSDNTAAQKLYSAIGFECDGEMHMSKQVK